MNSNSKPIFSLTVDEFIEALREGLGFSDSSSADENASSVLFHVSSNDSFGRIAFSPLVHIPRLPHNLLCSIHDCHNISHIRRLGFSDNPIHVLNQIVSSKSTIL